LGYVALTKAGIQPAHRQYYIYQTGVGTNILMMTIISFLVGLSISGQTFYTFILENLDKFAALKAIGAKESGAGLHDPVHGNVYGHDRYGLGIGLVTLMIAIARTYLPNYAAIITFWNLGLAFGLVLLIAGFSSYLGSAKS
jgi:putative ABC transport system permease protein